jgi:ADP-L-glycero-D-manno-heptose 6-epimerase
MIIVTGAAGFIGSRMIERLNQAHFNAVVAVDDFSREDKNRNLADLRIIERVDRNDFHMWLDDRQREVEFIFHLGARTDTAEFNRDLLYSLNTEYSMKVWKACAKYQIPLVYASSAATYGSGELGYDDSEEIIPRLKPLNPYGESKNLFDEWVINQAEKPFFWAGLKFFNVYGPHEDHKGRMASVIWHTFHQVKDSGKVRLFRSHNPAFRDGEQKRDFIFVRDVAEICTFLMQDRKHCGIFNAGTGKARSFLDLARAVFRAMGKPENIEFIETPSDIRDKYQYFTEAKMEKLRSIGYDNPITSLETGVEDYVRNYLMKLT